MRVTINQEQLRTAFAAVRQNPAFAESSRLVESGKQPVEMVQAMALRPEFLPAFAALSDAIYPGGIVERRTKEFIILAASLANRCQFCTDSHVAIAEMLGIGDATVEALEMLDRPDLLNDRERLAVAYARAVIHDSNRVDNGLFADLRHHFTDAEVVELTATIGFITMLNLFNNALHVSYHGEYGR